MLFLFLRSVRYRWLEYVLGALVVAVVVAALTVQRSLSASTEAQVHDLAHKLGGNMVVVPSEADLFEFYALRYGDAGMPDSHPEKILRSGLRRQISVIQPRLYGNIEPAGVPLVLVGEQTIVGGRMADAFSSNDVTLGETAAEKLALKQSDTLEVNGLQLTIDGVTSEPLDGLDVGVFGSLDLAQDTLDRPSVINAMRLAGCWCRLDVPKLALQVEDVLPDTKAMTVAGMLKAQKGTVAVAKRYSGVTLAVAVFLIATIVIVLIASQVKRQTREIGLLLATGASPWFVVVVFVAKAGIMGVLGGLGGYFLGFPLTEEIASRLIGLPLPVPKSLLGMTLALSIVVSMLSALVPAARAARLDPTLVLREI